MNVDHLVLMANQIARAFAADGEAKAVPETTTHIKKFWDRRMKAAITAHVEAGGAGLDPAAMKAVTALTASI